VRGRVTLDDFNESSLRDPAVLAVARAVNFRFRDDGPGTSATAGEMRITLRDGTRIEGHVRTPSGSPAAPASDAQLLAKFVDGCGRAERPPPKPVTEEVAQRILALDAEPDVGVLLATLFPAVG
jgi:2-methylcitrate dehydratase PrpD